jgi:MFS transporter, ACS family, D-galactonate transporter
MSMQAMHDCLHNHAHTTGPRAGACVLLPANLRAALIPESPTSARGTSRRWRIAALLGVGVLVNFFDRVNLSVAVVPLQQELHLTTVATGYLLSTYAWTYLVLQIPVGVILDRMGVRRVGRIGTFFWSVASLLTAVARGFWALAAARLLLGVAEAPTFPGNAKAVRLWFPREERGVATAMFDAAAKFAPAVGIPMVAAVTHAWGWRASFVLTGVLSLGYSGLFWKVYRDPADDPRLSPAEREHIAAGGGYEESTPGAEGASLGFLLQRKKVWGVALGMLAYNYNFYLLLTWLPGYLNTTMHLDVLHSGLLTAVPWLAATVCDALIGGWLVDHLIRRGHSPTRVRQSVLVIGMVGGLAIAGAAHASSPAASIAWISIALSGLAMTGPVVWSIPGLIAPPGSTARVAGIMNFAGNIPAIAAPVVTGYLVGDSRSFATAFAVAAAILVGGILSYILLLGKIETIPGPVDISSR